MPLIIIARTGGEYEQLHWTSDLCIFELLSLSFSLSFFYHPTHFAFFPNHIISSTLCELPHFPHTFDTARVELVFWMFSFLSCRCLPPQNSLCSIVISYRTEGRPGITCDCHTLTYVVWYDDNRAAAVATAATGNECERQFSASTEKIPESEPRVWKFQLWICTWKEFNN